MCTVKITQPICDKQGKPVRIHRLCISKQQSRFVYVKSGYPNNEHESSAALCYLLKQSFPDRYVYELRFFATQYRLTQAIQREQEPQQPERKQGSPASLLSDLQYATLATL